MCMSFVLRKQPTANATVSRWRSRLPASRTVLCLPTLCCRLVTKNTHVTRKPLLDGRGVLACQRKHLATSEELFPRTPFGGVSMLLVVWDVIVNYCQTLGDHG